MLQIRLLGQFDIRMNGKRVTIPSRAGQSLLAYLTLTAGTPHRREKLAGTFWPDTTDENARKNLRQELWRIRKAISAGQPVEMDYLLADEFTLTFNRNAEYWLDVSQMERPDLDLQSLISNLALYQGELLPGFYDEWITLERERIQAVFEARMEQLLEGLITAERWIAVQEWGERWLTLSGAREPAYRALMLASGVRGDMAKVASLYQRCTAELLEYLGVEPSAETRALYDGLLKGAKISQRTSAAQPSGTITFLFTDIEGSTRLLDKMGDQYAVALGEHHEILRASIQKWNGREVDTQGDAFFVTFTRAIDAVQCAAEAQRALAAHTWHQGENLRVRMGLHTGEPLIASTGYVGMDVHRAARIGDAGHGGQILLSQTTRELVIQDLPQGMTIRDLGEHRLKDMKYPSSIYQLVIDGLPAEFAPIRTKFTGTESPTPGEAPFKGLQFFDEDDSDLFFGRETLTAKLMNRLQDANFLSVIIGASGSGKSSLVRAGLVPTIKKGNANWQAHILTPTAHPLEALAIELTRDSESVTAAATLVDDLSKDPRSLHFFLSRQTQPRDLSVPHHTLLVIDQFEELFTLCRDEFEREAFIDNLLTALTPSPLPLGEERKGEGNLTLIITLRADFYAHLAQYPELRDAVAQQQEYIGPMTAEELRRAIEEPARLGHWEFEPGLVDLILRDVGDEPGALPLLSHALLETWKRRAGHVLTLKGYADAGGVRGAIAHTAESVFQSLSPDEQTIMRNILLRLTEFGEGTEDTRRRASFEELMSSAADADEVRAVLNTLAEARLITLSEDMAEVAHEALIREWPQLREWLSQDREGIILHRHLTEAAHEWELLERDAGSAYRGARLAQANEWSALNPNALNAQERLFLEASNHQMRREEQEREEQREHELASAKELAETQRQSASRLRTRNRVITSVASIAVILAMLAGMLGLRAENEKQLATSRELAAASIANLEVNPELGVLLALEAISAADTAEAEDALHRALQASRARLTLSGHTDDVFAITFSPDGRRIATASWDKTAKVWDAVTGEMLLTLLGHTDAVLDVAFSPDGKRIATASADKSTIVWDAATGKKLLILNGHSGVVERVVFSPDGKRIATASWDKTAKVWDASTGERLLALTGHTEAIDGIAFSPDGKYLVTASDDMTAKVWDAATGKELLTLSGHTNSVADIVFSPDGTRLATASFDKTAKIWDAATGIELFTLSGHTNGLRSVAFSADGKRMVTGGQDGIAKVWDAATGQELFTIAGHAGAINDVAISPECVAPLVAPFEWCGMWLATASRDRTAKVWDISPSGNREWLTIPTGHDAPVSAGTFSPDGTRAATTSMDMLVKVRDMSTGMELLTFKMGHTGTVGNVAFSPDNKRLATTSDDGTTKVWDLTANGEELLTISANLGGVVFSPDGTRLAGLPGDETGTVTVWDAATGQELLTVGANVWSFAFSPDGNRLATTQYDESVNVWATKVWDTTTGRELLTLSGHTNVIVDVAFSLDGTRLATSSFDSTAIVWDAASGEQLLTLTGHTATVWNVVFSPDGTRLATTSGDGTAKVWDAITGQVLLIIQGPDDETINGVAFNADGTRLLMADLDADFFDVILRVYALRTEELITLAKSRVTRSLTTEECQKYLHVDACPNEP